MCAIVPDDMGCSYSYDGMGYANPHAVTGVGGTTYTYDNNGNVTAIGSLDYSWDWRNRLASAERSGGGTTSYGYDHIGQRVFKATGSATTTYANRYYNVASSSLAATTTKHIFAPDGTLLATVEGSGVGTATTTYLHPDHLGGTNVATDADGAISQTLDYYPYGSQRIATGSFDEQRRFIGEEYDGDTDFSYLNARYYQGSRGQFMSQDTAVMAFDGSDKQLLLDPQQLNSYSYARNNPLTGERVYLAARSVGSTPGFHFYYYISPDQEYRITELIAPGGAPFTLGGGPEGPKWGGPLTFGNLVKHIGTDGSNRDFRAGLPTNPRFFTEISPSDGQTDEALIKALLRGHLLISPDLDYSVAGSLSDRSGNSNNYANSLAQYAGISNQFNLFTNQFLIAPGSSRGGPGTAAGGNSQGGIRGDTQIRWENLGDVLSFLSPFIAR
jgi:RHS repeat-associated protein